MLWKQVNWVQQQRVQQQLRVISKQQKLKHQVLKQQALLTLQALRAKIIFIPGLHRPLTPRMIRFKFEGISYFDS